MSALPVFPRTCHTHACALCQFTVLCTHAVNAGSNHGAAVRRAVEETLVSLVPLSILHHPYHYSVHYCNTHTEKTCRNCELGHKRKNFKVANSPCDGKYNTNSVSIPVEARLCVALTVHNLCTLVFRACNVLHLVKIRVYVGVQRSLRSSRAQFGITTLLPHTVEGHTLQASTRQRPAHRSLEIVLVENLHIEDQSCPAARTRRGYDRVSTQAANGHRSCDTHLNTERFGCCRASQRRHANQARRAQHQFQPHEATSPAARYLPHRGGGERDV